MPCIEFCSGFFAVYCIMLDTYPCITGYVLKVRALSGNAFLKMRTFSLHRNEVEALFGFVSLDDLFHSNITEFFFEPGEFWVH